MYPTEAATPAAERSPLWHRAVQSLTRAADASGMNLVMMTGRMMCGFGEPWAPSGNSRFHNPWAVDIFFPGRPRRDEAVSNCQSLLTRRWPSANLWLFSNILYQWVSTFESVNLPSNLQRYCGMVGLNSTLQLNTADYYIAFFKGGFFSTFWSLNAAWARLVCRTGRASPWSLQTCRSLWLLGTVGPSSSALLVKFRRRHGKFPSFLVNTWKLLDFLRLCWYVGGMGRIGQVRGCAMKSYAAMIAASGANAAQSHSDMRNHCGAIFAAKG